MLAGGYPITKRWQVAPTNDDRLAAYATHAWALQHRAMLHWDWAAIKEKTLRERFEDRVAAQVNPGDSK